MFTTQSKSVEEVQEWRDVPLNRSPGNQWRCIGPRDGGRRRCNRLLGLADGTEAGSLYLKRGDHHVVVYDLNGSAISVKCHDCGTWNWMFSDLLTEEQVEQVKQNFSLQNYDKP